MTKNALLSVFDKTGIVEFATRLIEQGYTILSTGGTLTHLKNAGLPVTSIESVTGVPELLDGRVKTLHPKIHAGILAKRDNSEHMTELMVRQIALIDLVCVNLYPFKATYQRSGAVEAELIEKIDIGGPTLLRAAAKNCRNVLGVIAPEDYQTVAERMERDAVDQTFRRQLAAKIFREIAAYDALIADYFTVEKLPAKITKTYEKVTDLRYGENQHQQAAYYQEPIAEPYSLANLEQLHGKPMSYNNMRDVDAALRVVAEFEETAVVALKHMNPCGIGLGDDLLSSWNLAYQADPVSIFGGVIAANQPVDLVTATKMHELFLEIIVAPDYDKVAFELLAKKKNLRLLKLPVSAVPSNLDIVTVLGGALIEERDVVVETAPDFKVVSRVQPTPKQVAALEFGQKVVKHVKSNAIVVSTDCQTLGVGAGQMNRIDSVKIAIDKAESKSMYGQAILASDAFFPMADCVEYAAQHGIKAIVEPGGSIKDQLSIDKADEYGIALVFTGVRHFKH